MPLIFSCCLFLAQANSTPAPLEGLIRHRLESLYVQGFIQSSGQRLIAGDLLEHFYIQRNFTPAWFLSDFDSKQIATLIRSVRKAKDHGLKPEEYHLSALEHTVAKFHKTPGEKNLMLALDLEFLASDAFFLFASHLLNGRINPETYDLNWNAAPKELNLLDLLSAATASKSVDTVLASLKPKHPHYKRLQQALHLWQQRKDTEAWQPLSDGPLLRPGIKHPHIPILKQRFKITSQPMDLYDAALKTAIQDFQKRHYLEADGLIGPQTRSILNQTPQSKVDQIKVNLERWRWLPQSFGNSYILINIAAFELLVIDDGQQSLTMDVIVGKPVRQTPAFSSRMRYLVLNPYWHVPESLARQDKLPDFRRDPLKMKQLGFRVLDGWGANAREIDPLTVNWHKIGPGFPYRLRQDPGPQNALGQVKFMFPNKFNVFIHDTPTQELFQKTVRSFSSGCVRVSQPLRLAEHMLRNQPQWSPAHIREALTTGKEVSIPITLDYGVHLIYWTVKVDGEDVFFLPDIYGRDQALIQGFNEELNLTLPRRKGQP